MGGGGGKRNVSFQKDSPAGLSLREKGGGGRNTNRKEGSQGRSLLHGQDIGKTQNHRNSVEQWLAVGGGWQLAVGGWWSLGAMLNKKNFGFSKDSPAALIQHRWHIPHRSKNQDPSAPYTTVILILWCCGQ